MKINIIYILLFVFVTQLTASDTKIENASMSFALKSECDILFKDISKYREHIASDIIKHNHDSAKYLFNYKVTPKHNKWKRYCNKLYSERINETQEKQLTDIKVKLTRI